jgi:MATE family multidrug resistance protein
VKSIFRLYRSDVRATLRLSYPIIIGQLGIVLMGVADTVMVGKLGAANLGAAGIANSIFFVIAVIGMGTLSVVAPQVATAKESRDPYQCSRLLRSGLWLGVMMSVVLAAILLLLQHFFEIFRQKPEIDALAKEYLLIISLSMVPLLLFMAAKQFSDGLSYTKAAMNTTVIGLVLNVLLNWLFISGNWGFPKGAGIATLISRILMAGMMIGYVQWSSLLKAHRLPLPAHDRLLPLIGKLLRLGLPGGFQLFFEVAAFSGAAVVIGWLGKYPLAAHQVAINLASITYMMASGFSAAGAIRVGEAVGLGSRQRVWQAGTVALVLSGLFMAVCCLLFLSASEWLVSLYISDPLVTPIATSLVVIAGFFQLSDGTQVVGLGILRGIADVNVPTLITLFAYWVIGLPVGYLLAFHYDMNVQGIWIGLLIGLTISALLLTVRFYRLSSSADRFSDQAGKSSVG